MSFDHGYAFLVGVGSPPGEPALLVPPAPQTDVPITVADAQAVAAVLRDPLHAGYPADHVKLLPPEDATTEGIVAGLDSLAHQASHAETVVVFYCGHGYYGDDDKYYLSTLNTR